MTHHNGRRILKEEQVLQILDDLVTPVCDLAERYGVKQNTISNIYMGNTWKHIPRKYTSNQYRRRKDIKLTYDVVKAIRSYERTDYESIAEEYGVKLKTVKNLLNPNVTFYHWKTIPLKGYENYNNIVNRRCKLTEEQVIEIYTNRSMGPVKAAKKYKVASTTISSIRDNKSWKNVTSKLQLDCTT